MLYLFIRKSIGECGHLIPGHSQLRVHNPEGAKHPLATYLRLAPNSQRTSLSPELVSKCISGLHFMMFTGMLEAR